MKPRAMLDEMKKKRPSIEDNKYRVRVGMATCGISAGADKVYDAFVSEVKEAGLKDVEIISTGCVGRCDLEPMAEVTRDNDPPVLYIRLDADKAKRIAREHLAEGNVVEEYAG